MMNVKKLFIPVTLVVMLMVTLQSCNQGADSSDTKATTRTGVEHYRLLQFSETPWDLEKGTHQLTAEEAKTVNNYKFTYDDMSRLVSVEYCRGNELLSYGSLGGAAKVTFTYEDDKQTKEWFNKEGEQIMSGGVYRSVYTLDGQGFRTALHFFDKEGNAVENRNDIHRYEWSKLDDGLIKELRYNLAGDETIMNPFCPFYELRFTYDSKGYVTNMANYEADTLYNCTAENCGDIGVCFFEFENNENGDLLRFSVHNTVGQLSNLYFGWAKRMNKVDDNGYLVEREMFDQDDEYVTGNNVPITAYKYDDHGAVVEMRNYDKSRVLYNAGGGVAITQYKYDDKGNRTETLRFDKDMVAVVPE